MTTTFAIVCFISAGTCGIYRLLVGPSLADRIAALDVALICLMGAIAVAAARTQDNSLLVLLPVIAIVGFTATVAVSRFIELESVADSANSETQSEGAINDK